MNSSKNRKHTATKNKQWKQQQLWCATLALSLSLSLVPCFHMCSVIVWGQLTLIGQKPISIKCAFCEFVCMNNKKILGWNGKGGILMPLGVKFRHSFFKKSGNDFSNNGWDIWIDSLQMYVFLLKQRCSSDYFMGRLGQSNE